MARACYCAVLRTAARKMTALYDEALKPVGIQLAQFSLLRSIERTEPVSLTELGRRTELDRSTVGRNVRLLQRMGLVRIAPGAEATVCLEEAGRAVLQEGAPLWNRAQRSVEAKLGAKAAVQLRDLLESF
jgi:DNA-binding MarR family transcriptional regulator